jgi:hypothetical protein
VGSCCRGPQDKSERLTAPGCLGNNVCSPWPEFMRVNSLCWCGMRTPGLSLGSRLRWGCRFPLFGLCGGAGALAGSNLCCSTWQDTIIALPIVRGVANLRLHTKRAALDVMVLSQCVLARICSCEFGGNRPTFSVLRVPDVFLLSASSPRGRCCLLLHAVGFWNHRSCGDGIDGVGW